MFLSIRKLLERAITWLLYNKNNSTNSIDNLISKYQPIIDKIKYILVDVVDSSAKDINNKKIQYYLECGVSKKLSEKLVDTNPLGASFDIINIVDMLQVDLSFVSKLYFIIGNKLNLRWIRNKVLKLAIDTYWERLSTKIIIDELYCYQAMITKDVVSFNLKEGLGSDTIDKWMENKAFLIKRYNNFIVDSKLETHPSMSTFNVALDRLKSLVS